jgi:hypothetical protein
MQTEPIYGIDYTPPSYPKKETIANYKELFGDQRFARTAIPESFNDIEFDSDGNAVLSSEQESFVQDELEKILHGHYFFNRGILTYITGVHYFYLQYYTLEDGGQPEYRETDRKWFCFLDYCLSKPYIKGVIRIKKRREGASSQAACFLLWSALTQPNSNCGIISKTKDDARDVFQKMISPAFNKLPAFLQPRVEDSESKTQLVFGKPKSKAKKGQKLKGTLYNVDRGLESKIDYRATALNSYDSGRVTALLCDESGKWGIEVPINKYWPIVKKTLTKGIKRVGFALLVSTVNDAENGGTAYKEIWDESNQFADKITGSGLYRYFSPAYEGLDGFIDKHGFSITENASEEMRRMFLETYGEAYDGSKDYCMKEREKMKDPVALSEEIRMMPFTEKEAFMISQQKCHFSVAKIQDQIDYLQTNQSKHYLRRGKFYKKDDDTVGFMDLEDGPWYILKFPTIEERNRRVMTDFGWAPANTAKYASGIDPHRHTFTKGNKDLSKTSAWIMERYDQNDPENTGLPVAWYYDRPALKEMMYDQMLFAGIFWGTRVNFEMDAGDDYYAHFKGKGLSKYIRWTPTCAVNPLKPGRPVPGISSKDPFALSKQLELGIAYIEHHCHKIFYINLLKELLVYDHDERQIYDTVVSFLIALIDLMGDTKPQQKEIKRDKPIIATYNLINNSKVS